MRPLRAIEVVLPSIIATVEPCSGWFVVNIEHISSEAPASHKIEKTLICPGLNDSPCGRACAIPRAKSSTLSCTQVLIMMVVSLDVRAVFKKVFQV